LTSYCGWDLIGLNLLQQGFDPRLDAKVDVGEQKSKDQ